MEYSTTTLSEACDLLGRVLSEDKFEDLMRRWRRETNVVSQFGVPYRCKMLFVTLRDNPTVQVEGRFLRELVVEEAASYVRKSRDKADSGEKAERFVRAFERDGYTIDEKGQLRPTLPKAFDLPVAHDEVHLLLARYNLTTPKGHLDQAIESYNLGNWAAANGQLRPFYESFFDEILVLLEPQSVLLPGEARRERLANLTPPFLSRALNEWGNEGKNFVNGILKRLHPEGPHPGLSDKEDCTFRLHLVLLTAGLFLRRLDAILSSRQ
jgi:hypothetical protein